MRPELLLDEREPFSTSISSVLIVDDSIEDSLAITRLLRQGQDGSLRVITAPNMLDALREFRHERPDCVLIDHRLADGEGIELLHMLTEVTAPLPAPVVYLASEDSPRLAVRALKAGALDYLAKSWLDAESLRNAIHRAIEKVAISKARYQRQRYTEDRNRDLQKSVQTLQQSEKVKEQITGLAPTFLYVLDLHEDRLVYTNPTMLHTLGYSEAEMSDLSKAGIRHLVHKEDLPFFETHNERLSKLSDGEVKESEFRLQHKDGKWIWLHFRETVFLRDKQNTVWQVIGSAEDITEQRASRHILEAKTSGLELELNDLKAVWDQNLIGIAITMKHRSNRLKLNSVLARMLNLTEEADLGSFARVFGFTTASSPVVKALTRGLPTRNVKRVINKADGTDLHLLETVHPLIDQDGFVTGCLAYFIPSVEIDPLVGESGERDDVWHAKLSQLQSKLEVAENQLVRARDQIEVVEQISGERQLLIEGMEKTAGSLRLQLELNLKSVVHADDTLNAAAKRAQEAEARLAEKEKLWQDSLSKLSENEGAKEELLLQVDQLKIELGESRIQHKTTLELLEKLTQEHAGVKATYDERAELLAQTETALAAATAARLEAQAESASNAALIEGLRDEVDRLKQATSSKGAAAEYAKTLEAKVVSLQKAIEVHQRQKLESESAILKLEEHIRTGEIARDDSDKATKTRENETSVLQVQLKELQSKLNRSEAEIVKVNEEVARLELLVQAANSERDRVATEAAQKEVGIASLRAELDRNRSSQSAIEESLDALHASVESALSAYTVQESATAKLKAEAQDYKTGIGELRTEIQKLQSQIVQSEQSSEDALREADAMLVGLELKLKTSEQDLSNAKLVIEERARAASELSLQLETLEDAVRQAIRRSEVFKEEKLDLAARLSKMESLAASRASSLADLEAVVNRSAENLAEARIKRDEAEKHGLDLEAQLATGRTKLQEAEDNWQKAENLLQARTMEVGTLKSESLAAVALLEKAKSDLETSETARHQAEQTIADWKKSAPDSEKALQEANEQLQTAQRELRDAVSEAINLKQSLDLASEQEANSSRQLAEISKELAEVMTVRDHLEKELTEVTASERLALNELAVLQIRGAELESQLLAVEAKLSETASLVEALEGKLDAQAAEAELRSKELAKVRSELEQSEGARKQAQDRLIENETKLVRVQQNLRLAEDKYQSLAASVPAIVFTTNAIGIIDFVNDRWESYVGESMQDSWAKGWKDIVFKGDLDSFTSTWVNGIREGSAFSIQFRLRRNDNQYRWHEMHAKPETEKNTILAWIGTVTEVHEQVVSREAARQARLRYGALLDSTSESVLFLSPSGNVLGASKSSLNLLRQGSEAVVGQSLWETKWWPKGEREKLQDAVRMAAAGEKVDLDTMRVDVDGHPVPARLEINPIFDENHQVSMLVPYFRDR